MRGRSVAVVGPSGAGKSTLIKTLVGLIQPKEWLSQDTPWEAFGQNCSFVSQQPFLFNASLRENLRYGLEREASDDEILALIDDLGLQHLIESHPKGLDTQVTSLQSNLSGGQLQRLVLVRALLRDQAFLVMDEATSAVDAQNEEMITKLVLSRVKSQRTGLVFVTHRLRWLALFDEIWFIEMAFWC